MFKPGPVHGHHDPRRRGEHRSFSMANTPGEPDRLEFMIKLYEGGHFSGLLADGHGIKVGDELRSPGPTASSRCATVAAAAACSSAAAPAWRRSCRCCGRWSRRASSGRPTFYYGARTEADLFHLEELERWAASCRTSASSRRCRRRRGRLGRRDGADHRRGRPHGGGPHRGRRLPVRAAADGRRRDRDAGAPGRARVHIYFDKFTTTAEDARGEEHHARRHRRPWSAASPSRCSPTPRPGPRSSRRRAAGPTTTSSRASGAPRSTRT